jgi:RIO-like serine/threonine protein kinase
MAMICIRNTRLEDLHAGVHPVTLTGDYSDVNVVDGTGQAIPWPQVSHIDDAQMAALMREIVNRLFTFHLRRDDQSFRDHLDRWMTASDQWDNPTLDTAFLDAVAELGSARKV